MFILSQPKTKKTNPPTRSTYRTLMFLSYLANWKKYFTLYGVGIDNQIPYLEPGKNNLKFLDQT